MLQRRAIRVLCNVLIAVAAGAFDLFVHVGRDPSTSLRSGGFPMPVGVVLIVIAAVALVFRRRYPAVVFGICWCVAFAALPSPNMAPVGVLLIALYQAGASLSARPAGIALAAALVAMGVITVNTAPVGRDHWQLWVLGSVIGMAALPLGAWAIGRVRFRDAQVARSLHVEHRRDLDQAVRDERRRLSHELHDIVSHTVSVMTLQAAGARAVMEQEPAKVGPALEVIERAGVQAMNELQRLLEVLRADDDSVAPIDNHRPLNGLDQLLDLARSSGQQVDLVVSGTPGDTDPSVELACYRIVQEGLTNARKHSGAAAPVRIRMDWAPSQLQLTIVNASGDGSDHPELSTGNGLAGLVERVQLIGGRLVADPLPDGTADSGCSPLCRSSRIRCATSKDEWIMRELCAPPTGSDARC